MANSDTATGMRQTSPMTQSNRNMATRNATGAVHEAMKSGILWAMTSSVWPAQPSMMRRRRPEAFASKYPSGTFATWARHALRMLAATRKAAV